MTSLRSPATNGITSDAVSGDHLVQRPGNRAANQRADAKLRQTKRLLNRQVIRQDFLRFGDDSSRLGLDDMNLPGDVEDRRDPIVPVRKCRFHHPRSCFSFTHGLKAIVVPTSKRVVGICSNHWNKMRLERFARRWRQAIRVAIMLLLPI